MLRVYPAKSDVESDFVICKGEIALEWQYLYPFKIVCIPLNLYIFKISILPLNYIINILIKKHNNFITILLFLIVKEIAIKT